MSGSFHPDWESECRQCGTSPTVVVFDSEIRTNSETDLCGVCFFLDKYMVDPDNWNSPREATE